MVGNTEFDDIIGYLLTMSPSAGVNYVNNHLSNEIQVPFKPRLDEAHESVLEVIRRKYFTKSESGFFPVDVKCLLVDLIAEYESTPTARGETITDIQHAYLPIVRDLVSLYPLNSLLLLTRGRGSGGTLPGDVESL